MNPTNGHATHESRRSTKAKEGAPAGAAHEGEESPNLAAEAEAQVGGRSYTTRPVDEFAAALQRARQSLEELKAFLPAKPFVEGDPAARLGVFRGTEESAALSGILAVIALRPEVFAKRDKEGQSMPFDTKGCQADLARRDALTTFAQFAAPILQLVDTGVLMLGQAARKPTLEVYALAKSVADRDEKAAEVLEGTLRFYGAPNASRQKEARVEARKGDLQARATRAAEQAAKANERAAKAAAKVDAKAAAKAAKATPTAK